MFEDMSLFHGGRGKARVFYVTFRHYQEVSINIMILLLTSDFVIQLIF